MTCRCCIIPIEKTAGGGLCKCCYDKTRYEKKKDIISKKAQKYYQVNKINIKQKSKEYRLKNIEKYKLYTKNYNKREYVKEKARKFREDMRQLVTKVCQICETKKTVKNWCGRTCDNCYRTKVRPHLKNSKYNALKQVHNRYLYLKRYCNRINRQFDLTLEQFIEIRKNNCEYCEGPLSEYGSGLDRSDNSKGYTLNNVVPCCKQCNWIKGPYLTKNE